MGRSPCCEKLGLNRGPWSKEEDDILINYIDKHGHPNWRQLPKLAGLLRCGKSCRLRWTNYLRPDIKRGNFTPEEEDTIIKLHQGLGNRWSAIAARLPGRTDNEIKNIWHTRLKKKSNKSQPQENNQDIQEQTGETSKSEDSTNVQDNSDTSTPKTNSQVQQQQPSSPLRSSSSSEMSLSENSCSNTTATSSLADESRDQIMLDNLPEADENFWSDVLWAAADDSKDYNLDFSLSPSEENYELNLSLDDNWLWDDLLSRANEFLLDLPEL